MRLRPPAAAAEAEVVGAVASGTANEYFAAIHSPARRNVVAHGGRTSGGRRRLQTITGLGIAPGRLSDHTGCHFLSRRQPGRHVVISYGTARAAIRTSTGFETDDIFELVWLLCHHTSVFTGPEH